MEPAQVASGLGLKNLVLTRFLVYVDSMLAEVGLPTEVAHFYEAESEAILYRCLRLVLRCGLLLNPAEPSLPDAPTA